MRITRQNCSGYFLDYIEGNLRPGEIHLLHEFLELNPDMREELDSWRRTKLQKDPALVFEKKASLKKQVVLWPWIATASVAAAAALLLFVYVLPQIRGEAATPTAEASELNSPAVQQEVQDSPEDFLVELSPALDTEAADQTSERAALESENPEATDRASGFVVRERSRDNEQNLQSQTQNSVAQVVLAAGSEDGTEVPAQRTEEISESRASQFAVLASSSGIKQMDQRYIPRAPESMPGLHEPNMEDVELAFASYEREDETLIGSISDGFDVWQKRAFSAVQNIDAVVPGEPGLLRNEKGKVNGFRISGKRIEFKKNNQSLEESLRIK